MPDRLFDWSNPRYPARYFLGLLGLALLLLNSCGGGGAVNHTTSSAPPQVAVTVSPSSASLEVGATQQFNASVSNSSNTAVTWSVNSVNGGDSTVGTISSTGLYTAPSTVPTAASVSIEATSQADPTASGSASISLTYPAPTLKTIAPVSVTVGSAATTVSVFGTGFNPASVVNLDGKTQKTSLVESDELTITVPADEQTVAKTFHITVTNPSPGGGTTSATDFTVGNLLPTLNSISPSTLAVGSSASRIALSGTNFMSNSTVYSGSTALPTTYVSASQLVTTIPTQSLTAAGTIPIAVTNPTPGGGTSNSWSLTVGNSTGGYEAPGIDQSTPIDLQYPVYLEGPAVAPIATSSSTSLSVNFIANETSPVGFIPTCASTLAGACVDGVTWIRQIPPPTDLGTTTEIHQAWNNTGNCGPASLVTVEHFLGLGAPVLDSPGDPSANIDMSDIEDVDTYMEDHECTTGETGDCFNAKTLGTADGWDYADYGPEYGVPIQYLAEVAEDRDKLYTLLVNPAQPSVDCRNYPVDQQGSCVDQQLQPLYDELQSGHPLIIHGYYEFGQDPASLVCGKYKDLPCGHYMVLVGMDPPGSGASSSVYVVDPGRAYSNYKYADYSNSTYGSDTQMTYTYTKRELATELLHPWWGYSTPALVICKNKASCTQPPAILSQSLQDLPVGQLNMFYSVQLSANFGNPPYTWSVPANSLPPGLTLDASTGVISGTPTVTGTFNFVVTVGDQNQNQSSGGGTIQIGQAVGGLTITTPSLLPNAVVGETYNLQLTNAGSATSAAYSLVNSSLPGELALSAQGQITGIPTTATQDATFTVQITGSTNGETSTKQMNLTVLPANLPPELDAVVPTPATVTEGGSSTVDCVASDPQGSALKYAWSFTGGSFSGSGSSVTWTAPSNEGEYTATCAVTDGVGQQASMSAMITVGNTPLSSSISPATGVASTTQFSVTGSGATANGGVTATITLPDGSTTTAHATASSTGAFSFTPFTDTQVGTYTEVDTDDGTGAKSNVLVWTVTPTGIVNVTPTNWDPVFTIGDTAVTTGLYISNQSGGSLTGTITAATDSGGQWLTVNGHSSDSWVAPGTEEITANPAGLAAGAYAGTLTVTSPNPPSTVTVPVTMTIYNALQITTTSLPDAVSGQPYSVQLQSSGGTGVGNTWSLVSGTLPVGISFSSSGLLSGTAGSLSGSTTETLKIAVQDSAGHQAIGTFSLLWRQALAILPYSPSNFQFSVGSVYTSANSLTLQAAGGTPPYTWGATGMPPGLTITPSTGVITGTPTQSGSFTATVTVTDSTGQSTSASVSLSVVLVPLTITTGTLPSGTVGVAYSQFVDAQGGSQNGYTWTVQGNLPPGLNATSPTGGSSTAGLQISGTPTQAGTYIFTAIVTDSLKDTAQQNVTVVINSGSPPQITTTTLNLATVGQPYSFTFTATGGAGGYKWSLVGSSPDPGLQLSSSGVLSGTSTVPNDCPSGPDIWVGSNYPSTYFQVQVTDAAGQSAVSQLCLPAYYPTPQITSLTPPSMTISGQQQTVTVNGTGFRSDAYVYNAQNVTSYVNSTALEITLAPSNPLVTDTTIQFWVVQPYSQISNKVSFPIYDPPPSVSGVAVVLNNSTQACTANSNCQLVITGGGLVYDTSYTIAQTGQVLSAAVYPTTPIPWSSITTSAFSLPAGTYTLDVTNPNQPNGGSATAVATFTVQ